MSVDFNKLVLHNNSVAEKAKTEMALREMYLEASKVNAKTIQQLRNKILRLERQIKKKKVR